MRKGLPWTALVLVLLSAVAGVEWGRRQLVKHDLTTSQAAYEIGELDLARRQLRRAARLAPGRSEPRLALAEVEISSGNYAVAEQLLEAVLVEDLAVELHARALVAAARVDLFDHRHERAARRADEALVAAQASGDPELVVRAGLVNATVGIESGGQAKVALAALERAYQLAAESGHEKLRAYAETEIGQVLWWYLREVDDPVPDYFEPALEVFQRRNDPLGVGHVLARISLAQLRADELTAFFETEALAMGIWEKLRHRAQQVEGHLRLGWAWDRLENPRRAHRHFEQALDLAQANGLEGLVPRIQRHLASVEHSRGRSELAVARLERLLTDHQVGDRDGRSVFGVLGDAHRRLGDQVAARKAYEHALELDPVGNLSFRVWIHSGLARSALAQDDPARARQVLSDLERRVGPHSDWSDHRRTLLLRAAVLEAESGSSAALAPLLEAAEIETRSLGSVGSLTVDYGLGVLKQLLPRLLSSDASTRRERWAAEAFRLLEQARLRPVRQQQLADAGRAQATDASKARESRARTLAHEAAGRAAANPSPEHIADLREAYARYEDETFRARSAAGSSALGQAATVAELQHHLAPKTAIVAYVLIRRAAVAMVVRHDRFEAIPLAIDPKDLRPRIKILRHQLATRRGIGWREPARELRRLLLDPVERSGGLEGIERLQIVPMGELHELPFAALLDAAGRPLIEQAASVVLPAASVLLQASPRGAEPGLVVGRGSFRGLGLPDLPAARREAQAVARMSQARLVFGPELTEQAFRQLAPTAARIHIVAHAQVDPEFPLLSRLILAPPDGTGEATNDGELTVRELLDLELRADLVTLSACRSGLALPATRLPRVELRRTGLVEGFLLAGARNVLGTLLPVEDEATAAFMTAFEGQLRDRQPIDALATVQRMLAAGDGPTSHPGHWSAFVLAGPGTFSHRAAEKLPTVSDPRSVEVQ